MSKIILAWKPRFMTSHDCLQVLKRTHQFHKLGHTGTLDPLACGLMGILVDDNTKFQHDLQKSNKTYVGKILLGTQTDSWDALGLPQSVRPVPVNIDIDQVKNYLINLKSIQVPKVSALKIKGKKALVSNVTQEEMIYRDLSLYRIELSQIYPDEIFIEAEVGAGTYIRSLAFEIGKFLGCGAILSELIRVKHHGFEHRGNIFDPCKILGEISL